MDAARETREGEMIERDRQTQREKERALHCNTTTQQTTSKSTDVSH